MAKHSLVLLGDIRNLFSLNFCHSGSDVVRMRLGCGSDAIRMRFGRGSDVFLDLVQAVWQKVKGKWFPPLGERKITTEDRHFGRIFPQD